MSSTQNDGLLHALLDSFAGRGRVGTPAAAAWEAVALTLGKLRGKEGLQLALVRDEDRGSVSTPEDIDRLPVPVIPVRITGQVVPRRRVWLRQYRRRRATRDGLSWRDPWSPWSDRWNPFTFRFRR